jgi:hypothetical protein
MPGAPRRIRPAPALRHRDDTAAEHFPELVLVGDDVGHRVIADQDVGKNRSTPKVLSPSRSIGVAMSQLNANLLSPSPDSVTRPPRPVVTLTLNQ